MNELAIPFDQLFSRRWKNVVAEIKRHVLLPLALGKNPVLQRHAIQYLMRTPTTVTL